MSASLRAARRCATVVAAAAVVGSAGASGGTAAAAPQAATWSTTFLSGTPWPFGVEGVTARTLSPGTLELTAGPMCNAIAAQTCTNYSVPLRVTFQNFTNGRSGVVTVGDAPVTVDVGPGTVGILASTDRPGIPAAGIVTS